MSEKQALFRRLPQFHELSSDLLLDRFLEYIASKGFSLYPAQEEAVLALLDRQNVILNTPTGSGKSLVAEALHFQSLAEGKRSFYTCPIKALVNEKFLSLCREFGPDQVGMITGDGSVNRDAPIICCTAEILANIALREGENARVDDVVMDEFHYYSDRDRGVAWQIPLLTLSRTRFLLMSATLGEMDFFKRELTRLNGRETAVITNVDRPVPLKFEYRETPLHETIKDLIAQNGAPIYLVNFTQASAAEEAQNLMSVDFASKELKKQISERLVGVKFSSPYGKEIQKYLKHGVGLHHAGLLPKYRVLVERLAQEGLLQVISGTDTLGVGINVPIRTVLFSKLCKFDGEKTAILSVRDFHQIAGRAGRKGFDTEGRVVAQAPEHVIENLRLEAKARSDPKKAKKIVKAKPPEKGFVLWTEDTFKKLISSRPEALKSRFGVTHGMLINVLARKDDDGCKAMRSLIRTSHDSHSEKRRHRKHAFELFRSLLSRKLIEFAPNSKIRVNVELQDDFSLNQTLSLWLIDTLAKLDRNSETYGLDVLTLVEAILENPDLIIRKQVDRLRSQLFRELKEAGVEYDERVEELEKVEHPKPLRDFVYSTFNEFADLHPWVGQENIRPKSVAREMFETFQSFPEYIRDYDLQRAEGVLLRYLSDTYRTLTQTVPDQAKSEDVYAIIEYFGAIVRQVDSTLMQEWEKLRRPESEPLLQKDTQINSEEIASMQNEQNKEKALRRRVANEIFRFVRAFSTTDFESCLELLQAWAPPPDEVKDWDASRLAAVHRDYIDSGHSSVRVDPRARHPSHMTMTKVSGSTQQTEWQVELRLLDPEEANDWVLKAAAIPSGDEIYFRLHGIESL